ncbi:unnamed protein product, partial [Rotaria sp. Silwood1]
MSEVDNDGMFYVRVCERLLVEIANAEMRNFFPKTNKKCSEWMCQLGSGEEFQPKVLDLIKAMEQDLVDQLPNVRVKIGVIGYTGV